MSASTADPAAGAAAGPHGRHCRNCEQPLPQPTPRFCPECGQETNLRPPTLGEFVQQFGGAYLATEGALWRTLKLLLLKPGELTRQYLAGRRKHYVLPLRLYLTISLVVLLALRATATIGLGIAEAELPKDRPRSASIDIFGGAAGLKDGKFYCTGLPAWACQRLQRRLDVDPAQLMREMQALAERFVANVGAAMFVLLPGFALALKLVYWNRRLRYTEHLVFALHVHAFWFTMLALTLPDWPWFDWVETAALVAVPAYTLLAMRRVYGGRWGPRLLRAALVSTLYGVMMGLAMAGVGFWALLF